MFLQARALSTLLFRQLTLVRNCTILPTIDADALSIRPAKSSVFIYKVVRINMLVSSDWVLIAPYIMCS